ncbi:proton-associated sugar transporter A isoform X1 [Adelges cooleyi]|uniref:proton-associated sugar transporter A isoform X1 n=1 Tax=Adelges cooleyi TaxID=133065 RepID=UPI002180088B|nr:proton-associated sugar transporter A isoform X1 [Adelges cooleyi]XP_050419605.1 proton-associated sugar transporter A isoform X1 [Adelges cooleyi]
MVDKLHEYQGPVGIAHTWRDALQERWYGWKENRPRTLLQLLQSLGLAEVPGSPVEDGQTPAGVDMDQYSHIFRKKTRRELIRISAAVMGIEFSYAAETAFVSPTLLKIGVDHQHMTLVWAVSPCIGFFVTPILGSLSDRCTLPLGRRRPFLILLACGVFLGMMLVPNGESLGHWVEGASGPGVSNFWPIFFTVLGTVLLDFDADACQSPARAYLLDICVPEDHAKGLSTFTVMAGLGGFVGYLLGAVDWDSLKFGELMGGHVRAVFTLVTFLFVGCISYTVSSFKEMPLKLQRYNQTRIMVTDVDQGGDGDKLTDYAPKSYGTLVDALEENNEPVLIPEHATFTHYLKTIVVMPTSIKLVCLTNLFCWMAHVCYSLYFTDYVGEAVFGGDPTAPPGSQGKLLYEQGVRFGSMGMSMYSLSCACYSSVIEKFIKRFGAKRVYTGGLLFYSAGMFMMAVTRHKFSVIFFSWAAGVMYSTMFTMPFLLIAHYHSTNKFSESLGDNERVDDQIRGLGTDVAVVSSSVFVAQFILSMCMGTIVNFFGTTSAVVYTASFLGFCASLIASQIVYMDL